MKFLRSLFFTNLFYFCLLALATIFVVSFFFSWVFIAAKISGWLFFVVILWDIVFLWGRKTPIQLERNYPDKLSNGDLNDLEIIVTSEYPRKVHVRLLEELPVQFQIRNFEMRKALRYSQSERFQFQVRPLTRGLYDFGKSIVLVSYLGFVERKFKLGDGISIPCYPSFIQLRKYILLATSNRLNELGVKRIRRIGATLEFERIKEYTRDNEYRFINWKATARARKLMVNQYEDERSQPIYSFIDTGRSMRMPFEGLTLLDYAINSTLVLSNVSIVKDDKAGLLTFSKTIETHIVAEKRNHQMNLISEALYNVKTDFKESEYGTLYDYVRRNINQRALVFLYTNFETLDALYRQMPYLKLLNKSHILVMVVFKNTELEKLYKQRANRALDIYNQIVSEKFRFEKQQIIQELKVAGIQTIFTEPQHLTVNSINKYLEIKARGLI